MVFYAVAEQRMNNKNRMKIYFMEFWSVVVMGGGGAVRFSHRRRVYKQEELIAPLRSEC